MSRHRNVRNMTHDDYYDEEDDYDDDYYDDYDDDEYCCSPGTMKQYTYGKSNKASQPQAAAVQVTSPAANRIDNEKLTVCVDLIHGVVGDSFPYKDVIDAAKECQGDHEKAIDLLLSKPRGEQQKQQTNTPKKSEAKQQSKVEVITLAAKQTQPPVVVQSKPTSAAGASSAFNNLTISSQSPKSSPQFPKKNFESPRSSPHLPKKIIDFKSEYEKHHKNNKKDLSMVVIGHVDAGKSTLMGNLLYQTGHVSSQQMSKNERESKKVGKSSFAYAWVLDNSEEERNRGITMDIACNSFETEKHNIMLMDAPGHRDFIPHMLSGASQADVAVLVVSASKGEFEAGFHMGGQTREHAMLVRTLGINQIAVAVNKLDTTDWSQSRYDEIQKQVGNFLLKQAGFRDCDVTFVPVSGLLGANLIKKSSDANLTKWYKGGSLIEVIDKFELPQRSIEFPLRFTVTNVTTSTQSSSALSLFGKVESGGIMPNTKVMIMPSRQQGLVKRIEVNNESEKVVISGQHCTIQVSGLKQPNEVFAGDVVCSTHSPIKLTTSIRVRIVIFDIDVSLIPGFRMELHHKSFSTSASFAKFKNRMDKTTGRVTEKKPKILKKGETATVEITTDRVMCCEEYKKLKEMGRVTLRYSGKTIAAGIVTKILN